MPFLSITFVLFKVINIKDVVAQGHKDDCKGSDVDSIPTRGNKLLSTSGSPTASPA